MNKQMTIAVLLLVLAGCASSDPWTRTDTVMYTAYVATLVTDAHTTSQLRKYDNLYEAGPARYVLGRNPAEADTWQYFGTLAVSQYFIARALPKKWRRLYLGVNTAAHGYASANNFRLLDGEK